ncbi:transporter substrate-binding domain-containing protein [Bosea lathyri]|uniref:Cyclohexadienyl dehydratase n=1 Tax=Bosea lathyri TaxID=1036778 RepID=A0A1H6A7J2_9HYPH|nr:transporter substrate-binding domain-containing protein [Bosea lathyri]SEG43706.1 cyclohexadienyl dehydratase [Bosea lathyri]
MPISLFPALRPAALAITAGLAFSGLAMAQAPTSQLDTIQSRGALQICTTGDYKPFTLAKDGGYEGIDIELAKSLAKAIGVEAKFVATKWSDLLADFTAGKCDIAMGGISVTLDRQKRAFFSTPYLINGKAPIVRCADKAKYQSVADIDKPDVRVIVNPGGTNERFVRANFKQAKIEVFPDNVTIFDQILAGKADIIIAESIETKVQEKAKPGLCAVNPDEPLQYGEMGYLLPRGDVTFKAFVDQWLHLAKATGEFAGIYNQFVR